MKKKIKLGFIHAFNIALGISDLKKFFYDTFFS